MRESKRDICAVILVIRTDGTIGIERWGFGMGPWILGSDFDPLEHDSGIEGALRVGKDVVRPDGDKGGVPWILSSTWGALSTFFIAF